MSAARTLYYPLLIAALMSPFALQSVRAEQPTYFTFTPKFQDPDPGKRIWEWRGSYWTETLPSGRHNTFRPQKRGTVNGFHGAILQKVEEPNFFVFVADAESKRKELWWWRDQGPWKFMGFMENMRAPQRIDP